MANNIRQGFLCYLRLFAPRRSEILAWARTAAWVLFVAAGLAAVARGHFNALRTSYANSAGLMMMSSMLVVIAWTWWREAAAAGQASAYPAWLFFGMSAGCLGDLILADFIVLPQRTIGGMLAFGVGHLCYIGGYRRLNRSLESPSQRRLALWLGSYWVLAAWFWAVWVRNPQGPALLNYGALGYAFLLGGMAALATYLAWEEPRLKALALGANLFLLSDIILGNHLLRQNNWFLVSDVVWLIYISGQALIVASPATALKLYRS